MRPARLPSAAPPPARPAASTAAPRPLRAERTIYRTSARIGSPRKEFPTRLVLTLVAVAFLIGGALVVCFDSWRLAKHAGAKPVGPAVTVPAKTPEPSPPEEQKAAEPAKIEAASPVPGGQRPAPRKDLSFAEKAKITELNHVGAIYYREGGCEKALPPYQQVLVIDPGNPTAYAAVERCYSKARNQVSVPPPKIPVPTTPTDASAPPDP